MPLSFYTNYNTLDLKYVPIGFVFPFSSTTLPNGFAECNGAIITLSSEYNHIYNMIGNIYGGVAGVSFGLPDYRGYFQRGLSGASNNDPDKNSRTNRGDGVGGNIIGSKQSSQFKSHYHIIDYWRAYEYGGASTGDTRPLLTDDLWNGGGAYGGSNFDRYVNRVTDNNYPGASETIPKNIRVVYAMRLI